MPRWTLARKDDLFKGFAVCGRDYYPVPLALSFEGDPHKAQAEPNEFGHRPSRFFRCRLKIRVSALWERDV